MMRAVPALLMVANGLINFNNLYTDSGIGSIGGNNELMKSGIDEMEPDILR